MKFAVWLKRTHHGNSACHLNMTSLEWISLSVWKLLACVWCQTRLNKGREANLSGVQRLANSGWLLWFILSHTVSYMPMPWGKLIITKVLNRLLVLNDMMITKEIKYMNEIFRKGADFISMCPRVSSLKKEYKCIVYSLFSFWLH